MGKTERNKPLRINQRKFVDLIVKQGLSKQEAYCLAFGKVETDENREAIRVNAYKTFNRPQVQAYYTGIMEEVHEREVKKSVWNKELSTEKLVRLIEKAEQDIYGDDESAPKQLTMSRVNAILLPVKELNLMNGLNQTNLNFDGQLVQINGEDELKD